MSKVLVFPPRGRFAAPARVSAIFEPQEELLQERRSTALFALLTTGFAILAMGLLTQLG